MRQYFANILSKYSLEHDDATLTYKYWQPFRQQVIVGNQLLKHDVTVLRQLTYRLGFIALGCDETLANQLANEALAQFSLHRSNFNVPNDVHRLLAKLSDHYTLIAITNGNVNVDTIDIRRYFDRVYQAGNGLISKPDIDMFHRASNETNIPCNQILHVGDCGRADVIGGMRAGMQTAWVSTWDVGKPLSILPHVEINHIVDIQDLV